MQRQDPKSQLHIGFILLPGFALMSFASAIEPLRAANLLAGQTVYRISVFTPDGQPAGASSGFDFAGEPLPAKAGDLSIVFVCAGGSPSEWNFPGVVNCLRLLAREGVRLGGISGGAYILAKAGLLNNRDFTIHWEHAPALHEAFPDLRLRQARFVLDGDRLTCGGGVAPLDMMNALITERLGADFAQRVSDWFLHTAVAEAGAPQRASMAERFGVHHPALLAALEQMEARLEAPLSRQAVARLVNLSSRQLDRLFSERMRLSFANTYKQMRLEHARRLLQQSSLSISEISFATGFSSPGHFSRSYKEAYGLTPRAVRGGPGEKPSRRIE